MNLQVWSPGKLIELSGLYWKSCILHAGVKMGVFPAIFSINMLLGTDGGQSYSQKQIIDMLANAGVKKIKRGHFKSLVDSGIISGIV